MKTCLFFILALITLDSYAQELLKPNLPDSVTIIQESAPFRKSPENTGEVIYRVKAKTKAELLGIENDHLKVKIDAKEGFISYAFIDLSPPGLKNYFDEYRTNLRMRKEVEKDSIAKEIFRQEQLLKNADFQEKLARFTKKYGGETGKKIAFGHVWIGMSREMLIESKGYPLEINRTVTANLEREQFVNLNQKYVYVENGKVSAWQD